MAKITLLTNILNFWVLPELTTKEGFTIGSNHATNFFLTHQDFNFWLIDADKIPAESEAYKFVCNDDGDELNQLINEFLTLEHNTKALAASPFPVCDAYECVVDEVSVMTAEEVSLTNEYL